MAFDPFEGRVITSPYLPPDPGTLKSKTQATKEDDCREAMRKAQRSWIYPIVGAGILILDNVVIRPQPNLQQLAIAVGIVGLLFVLGGFWRFFAALLAYKRTANQWMLIPLVLGACFNLPVFAVLAQFACLSFGYDLFTHIERFINQMSRVR
jgi:hypothetical protein